MKQTGKRICSLLLAAILLLGIFSGAVPYAYAAMPSGNAAMVQRVGIEALTDGSAPWDENDDAGNDSGPNNKIVRSFDALSYNFKVEMASEDSAKSYSEVYVRLEFTLPLPKDQAEFDTAAMGWMEKSGVYAYQLKDDGDSQTLVCYKHREDNGKPVIPGNFTENLSIKVMGMANGSEIKPVITASIEGNTQDVRKTVCPDTVRVSAAPKFNIKIGGGSDYKDAFDFNTGNTEGKQIAPNYGISATPVQGRMMNIAACLELYNDKPDKGFKGLELPNGGPITFRMQLGSEYRINTPTTEVSSVDAAANGYMPLLYSVDGNKTQPYGTANGDGRILYSSHNAVVAQAPYNEGGNQFGCYNGGIWSARQLQDETGKVTNVVEVTVTDYQINVDQMPTIDGDNATHANEYGRDKGIGVFSAGEFWIVQPFNMLNSTNPGDDGNYDIVAAYGEGSFTTSVTATDLKITTVGNTVFQDSAGTSDHQQVQTDDRQQYGLELLRPGALQNRVFFSELTRFHDAGVNVDNQRFGDDVAASGTEFYFRSGFTYNAANEEGNRLFWGTNLLRFTSGVFDLTGEVKVDFMSGTENQGIELITYYAAKPDGTGWNDYDEMLHTYEDDLVFYSSIDALNDAGKVCVGVLHCFKGPAPAKGQDPHYCALVRARVRDDVTPNTTAVAVSTSRVWTKKMWEDAGSPAIPDWADPATKLASFPSNSYFDNRDGQTKQLNSGNIDGSTYYVPAVYDEANNLTPHNSDWGHWGDTMLFIGYKSGVTMTELQKVNGQEKETYALDKSQREADFLIQPRANFDKNSGDGTLTKTTDLTITLTLPKYMAYIEGSAVLGGAYTQSSANGGVRGTVTGGTPISPSASEPVLDEQGNPTGEVRLTWTLKNVTVGQVLEPIYYSAFIGSKSPEDDCPQGTLPLSPTVTISGTEDRRAFTASNGNKATQGITVIKGAASAFTKYVKADKVEADGTVDYVIYSANNATSEEALYLLDTMPCNAQNGSSFTGIYHFTGWKLDTALCDASKLSVYYTEDTKYSNATAATVPQAEAQSWTQAQLNADGTITDMNGKRPVAWAMIGALESNKAVNIDLQIRLEPDFDTFVAEDTVYVNKISSGDLVATAAARVVQRTISGLAWSDDDGDGRKTDAVNAADLHCNGTTFYSAGVDPILSLRESTYAGITDAKALKQIKVVMSGSPNSLECIKLYFRANGSDWGEDYRVLTNPKATLTEEEKEYVFDMSSSPYWKGSIDALRLDPLQGEGLSFNIKSITYVLENGTERVFDFCTVDAYKNYVILSNLSNTPTYPGAEDISLPEEGVFSSRRLGTTFTAADDGHGDMYFLFRETMFCGLSTENVESIRVVASGDPSTVSPIKLYYATGEQTYFSEAYSQELTKITREESTYIFKPNVDRGWKGKLNGLRIDPLEGANLQATLKSIMIDLTDGTTRTFDLTVEGAWDSYLIPHNTQQNIVTAGDSSENEIVRDSVKVSLYKHNTTGGTTFHTEGNPDAILNFQNVMYQNLRTGDVASVHVVMSGNPVTDTVPQLFYISDYTYLREDRSIHLKGQKLTGEMKEYVFNLTGAPGWAADNPIRGFRLDPLQASNTSFTIRSISLELTDGSMRTFDFTEPGAYQNLVTTSNLTQEVTYPAVDPDDAYSAVTYPDATPVFTYLGQSVSAKYNSASAKKDYLSGSYEFRDLPGGTYMVRFESGTTDLSQFDRATNAYCIYDAQNHLTAAELRDIVLPTAVEDYASTGNDVGFYGKTVVVLNYDRKVAVNLHSYRSAAPTVTFADQVDSTVWNAQLKRTDSNGREITFAELGTDGKVHITPYDLIYSKENPDASLFCRLAYPDGTVVIHEVTLKPADVIYYEESNVNLITFTDGQRGKWFKVTDQYRHEITADATDYDSNANGQYQDADTHTDDYDSRYTANGDNLYFSAGTARMVNVTTEIKDGTLSAPYPTMRFAFFGTGFELVSMGTPYGGVINVQVYAGDDTSAKPVFTRTINTRYGVYFGEQEDSETAPPVEGREVDRLYQGVALIKDDLTYGMYTVVCTPMYSSYFDPYGIGYFDILVDGIRILNPIGTTPEYERTGFNDILTPAVSLYITEYGKTELSDKLEHGPNYEIHLAPQQSIAVKVNAKAGAVLRVGAQSFTGAVGEFSVYSVEEFTDNASTTPIYEKTLGIGTEMHYPVRTWDADGTQILLFKNTGEVPISLTSFEYLPGTVTELSCRPEDTAAALPLAGALLPLDPGASTTGTLGIYGASLLLSSDFSINFYVAEENLEGIENPYMVCIKNLYDKDGNVVGTEEKKLTAYTVRDGKRVYTFNGISAMEMGSIVTATMHGTKNGVEVKGSPVNYSVKTYATNQLARENTAAKLKTLLVDMLNYGASAQAFWNYNTKNPVNAELTDEQKACATQTQPTLSDCLAISDNENAAVKFSGASLLLKEKVAIKYYLQSNGYEGKMSDLTIRLTYTDANGETQTESITGDKFTIAGKNSYTVTFDGLDATQMRTPCIAEIFDKDGNKVSGTLTYGIEAYAARKTSDENADPKLSTLLNDMMKYGDSTCAYFGKSTVPPRIARQAYELCFANSMDEQQSLEGIESGWELDNRAGLPKLTSSNNGLLSDVNTQEHSRLLRYFNRVTEGRLDLQFKLTYSYGFDGNVLRLCDEDGSDTYYLVTKDGAFWLKTRTGELQQISEQFQQLSHVNILFRVIIDLDRQTSTTYINNTPCGTYPLTGSAIRCLSFETLDETCNITNVHGGFIQANYAVFEDFYWPTSSINCEFSNADQLSLNGEAMRLNGGVTTERSFEPISGKVSFRSTALLPNGSTGSISLRAGGEAVVEITAKNGKFYANGIELKQFTDQLWYDLRIEADMQTQKADIKVNNQVVKTVSFLVKTSYVDGICLTNSGTVAFSLDNIMVNNLLDYDVPAPQKPEGADDYIIGINVCSLWENASHWGWATISAHDDLKPVLGYYDEGLTETADWETKFMVEHGIDFQAFCWYAGQSNAPLSSNRFLHMDAFMNSKYCDQMKFCLLWEAANGARPADSNAFRNYYVPYFIEYYFSNPSYMVIDNKPVLAIFGADKLMDQFGLKLKDEFDYLRAQVKEKLGYDGVIILDCHGSRNDLAQYGFDGWYAYNWGTQGYSLEHNKASNLSVKNSRNVYTVPTISVGFNDVGWHQTRNPLMSVADYKAANEWVRDEYLPNRGSNAPSWSENFVMLSTWNEYGEGTYLMPADGLNGFGYLDVLREVYTKGGSHTDVVPNEEQLERITHNYPQDRRTLRRDGNYVMPESNNKKTLDFTVKDAYKSFVTTGNLSSEITVSSNGTTFKTGSSSNDANLFLQSSTYQGFTADDVIRIRVVASGIPSGQSMQLFFSTNGSGISEGNSIRANSTTTAETTFLFDVGLSKAWTGEITGLRLDPLQAFNTSFTIKSISFEFAPETPELYINGVQMAHTICPETRNNVDYFPFEPGVSLIQYQLYAYHEWNYATSTLTLYRNKHSYTFTAGKNYALVDGQTQVPLGGTIFLQDGVPMLPIQGLAHTLGLHCSHDGKVYYITTAEQSLYEHTEGVWKFNTPGDSKGWSETNATISFGDDFMQMTAVKKSDGTYDPMMSIGNLDLDCSVYKTLEIKCKWSLTSAANGRLGFYFTTDQDKNLSESKTAKCDISSDSNGYQILRFDMSANANWNGMLNELRFDPFDCAGTIEIAYIRFAEAEEEQVLLQEDAESGNNVFFSGNAKVVIDNDPHALYNQCYHVTGQPNNWLYMVKDVTFTPGTTYQINFDVMLDPNGKNDSSELFCNMRYLDADGKTTDHIVKGMGVSKSDGWLHYSASYTVPASSTNRNYDQFTIYSNPKGDNNERETAYYVDNVRVVVVG